jgi:hypothetical protein
LIYYLARAGICWPVYLSKNAESSLVKGKNALE